MRRSLALALCALLGSCSAASPVQPVVEPFAANAPAGQRIQHVVIVIQENRSFDNLFATYPGADGTTLGATHQGVVPLSKQNLIDPYDLEHGIDSYLTDYDGGRMDGFDSDVGYPPQVAPPLWAYQYVVPSQISTYWTLASRYVLADRTFMTQGSDSFVAHQDLVAGGTAISPTYSVASAPDSDTWGCDAPPGTVTWLVTADDAVITNGGPFPCFAYPTLADLLDRRGLSWHYYAAYPQFGWSAFEAIRAIRYGSDWHADVSAPPPKIFTDIAQRDLAAVTWVTPDYGYSDHPGESRDDGPSWVGDIVNAIGKSPYWDSTVVVVLWDDWGGFYDHVAPRQVGFGGLGFRVPMLIVSAYARRGYVDHTSYEFGSVLRFIENTWGLGRLGSSDVRAKSIAGALDFSAPPRRFVPVPVAHPPGYFLSLPPSNRPIDDN